MPKPCKHAEHDDKCRLCYLYQNDPRYTALWDGKPNPFPGWPRSEINAYRGMSTTTQKVPTPKPREIPYPQETYVISLPRRTDRRQQVTKQFGEAGIKYQLIDAIDGSLVQHPDTWTAGAGAWGCRLSHMMVLDHAMHQGYQSVHVCEDDVQLCPDYNVKLNDLIRDVTALDPLFDAIFPGGQMMEPPVETDNPNVLRVVNCHRTHDYIVRGSYIRTLYEVWADDKIHHCDWTWGGYKHGKDAHPGHQREYRVYAPRQFLSGQSAGRSDINGRLRGLREWQPRKIEPKKPCGSCRKAGK